MNSWVLMTILFCLKQFKTAPQKTSKKRVNFLLFLLGLKKNYFIGIFFLDIGATAMK